ncbi:hypothetical protein [Deinococcus sp. QL22]|uniref:hypothetical protein n=1 Tax=Deinococcus sp. QL22 TaxID=2939437 RepID=UPI00201712C5|nr:hypothetical protein [Deinococcus sp. QL22]UQN08204.1 hypothetical protein M1R55_19175 [Deinococcus sp. QL22]
MNRFPLLLALLLASSPSAQPAPAPTPAALTQERELTRRALSSDYGSINVEAQILVGQRPSKPLGPLPSVPASRLLGSIIRTSGGPEFPNTQSLYFDSSASPAQVQAALQTQLKALGWTAFAFGPFGPFEQGGFQAEEQPAALAYYRLEQQVSFDAQLRRVGAVTRVTLNLNQNPNLREQLQFQDMRRAELPTNLPALRPPSGASVQPKGTGGGGGSWNSSASIQSSSTAAQLLGAYGTQLQAAGWTLLTKSVTGKTVTSVWRFSDVDQREVTGVLTLQTQAPGRYAAQLASLTFRN